MFKHSFISFVLLQHIVWYHIVLSYQLAGAHWLTFITESAEVRVYHYYASAATIYLGNYFTRCQDILVLLPSKNTVATDISWHLPHILHHLCINITIMIYKTFTWQWSWDIFGHEELLLLVEEPRPVGVQLGDVDQVQLDWIFFPEHEHKHFNRFRFMLCIIKVIARTSMKERVQAVGFQRVESTFQSSCSSSSSSQRASKPRTSCVLTKLPTNNNWQHQHDNNHQWNPMLQNGRSHFKVFLFSKKYISSRCSSCTASHQHTQCPWWGADSRNSFKSRKKSKLLKTFMICSLVAIHCLLYQCTMPPGC